VANYIAKWDGGSWSGLASRLDAGVAALAISGSNLYVGGGFTTAGGKAAAYAAQVYLGQLCTLTCASDFVQNSNPGQCGAPVNYPAPTAFGPCGAINCAPPPGTFFPIGAMTVTCSDGASASCAFTVIVVDVETPTITCPATVVVTNNSGQPSTAVNFSIMTTDDCPGVTQSCTPQSGSSFPIGTNMVNCLARDSSGNRASCSFAVIVGESGPLAALQAVLSDLKALRDMLANKKDRKELDDAIGELSEVLDRSLWLDQRHLQSKHGEKVFQETTDAVQELEELIKRKSSVADATLQRFVDRILMSERLLAQIALDDARAASGKPNEIKDAIKALAKGDDQAAKGKYESALEHYQDAWKEAIEALKGE
jgi:hypothetical protein